MLGTQGRRVLRVAEAVRRATVAGATSVVVGAAETPTGIRLDVAADTLGDDPTWLRAADRVAAWTDAGVHARAKAALLR